MTYFLDTTETIPDGVGFSQYGGVHLTWIAIFLVIVITNYYLYRKLDASGRDKWRKIVAGLIVFDEVFKMAMLTIGGRYNLSYLPLHLCSINIFIIAVHVWKPNRIIGAFLYTVCIPGALAAILFPSWTSLPVGNFMHLHSFTVHILLALYPIVLAVNGELNLSVKVIPKCLLMLIGMAIPIYLLNLLMDTNFMFLMSADEGNPLYLFEQMWGNHLYGFPVIIVGILIVMFGPILICDVIKNKKNPPV